MNEQEKKEKVEKIEELLEQERAVVGVAYSTDVYTE